MKFKENLSRDTQHVTHVNLHTAKLIRAVLIYVSLQTWR